MNSATDTMNADVPGGALKILIVDDHAIMREGPCRSPTFCAPCKQ
jgi:hypothetical protein